MLAQYRLLFCLVALGAAGPLCAGEAAPAEEPKRELLQPPKTTVASPITDRFAIRGLYLVSDAGTAVRYDSSAGTAGTLVNGETTLGFPARVQQPSLDMTFRMGQRNRIHADAFKMNRKGDVIIGQQILFGDAVFQPGERVTSSMELRKLGIAWTHSVLKRQRVELGLGLALHLMQLDGDLQAPARFERERLDAAGPFPTLRADATWRVTRRFSLNLAGNWLGAHVDAVKGHYQFMHGDLQFRVRPNFAVGAGYSRTLIKLDSNTTDFAGHFGLRYKGPEAFLRVSF